MASVCFALVLIYTLFSATSPRQAGNSGDGGIELTQSQLIDRLLTQAEVDVAEQTRRHRTQRLREGPQPRPEERHGTHPERMARLHGRECGEEDRRSSKWAYESWRRRSPWRREQSAPRLYFAIVADSTPGNQRVAKAEFEEFLKLKPSVGQLAIARPFLTKLGITIPS